MTQPDSLLSRIRRWLAGRIEPEPPPGEAWCVNCSLNNGSTQVLSPDGIRQHQEQHGDGYVRIQAAWPSCSQEGNEEL